MPRIFVTVLALLLLTSPVSNQAMENELKVGDAAPDFELLDQNGKSRRLADFQGRWLVLYFYPKDDTPGCTTEACNFRDDHIKFDKINADVLGVSVDDRQSHTAFSKKYALPFPLLSDIDGNVARLYGSLFSFGPFKYARRHTFIIDPEGRIAKIYRKVKPGNHSDELQRELEALQSS